MDLLALYAPLLGTKLESAWAAAGARVAFVLVSGARKALLG